MTVHRASGPMTDSKSDLHHIRLLREDDGAVVAEHYRSERDPRPQRYRFETREDLLDHLDQHGAFPESESGDDYRPAGDQVQDRPRR